MVKEPAMYVMSFLYLLTGAMHFIRPVTFLKIIPPALPAHAALVYISGAAEILLAVMLLIDQTRSLAAWGLILLLIAVFPANIYMAMQFWQKNHPWLWIAFLRLPLQAVLIWWAYRYT